MAVSQRDQVLSFINSCKENGATNLEITQKTGLTSSTVSSATNYLFKNNLIKRTMDGDYIRNYSISIDVENYYSPRTLKPKTKNKVRVRTVYELVKGDEVIEIDEKTYNLLKDILP